MYSQAMDTDQGTAPTDTNSLALAASSYLHSARHQPVEWQAWSEAAFARAQAEDKPILLDIGAVWGHWCDVMDREAYENPQIAALINEHFVAIKVDRDERPDVDARYQAGVSAISGQGGWPLTAILTPDGRPYFGGTYFSPDARYGRPGFGRVLLTMAQVWRERRDEALESAASVMAAIEQNEGFSGRGGELSLALVDKLAASAIGQFDPRNGGFGSQPKFPHPAALDLLLELAINRGNEEAHKVFTVTLDKMAHGGVYDQLAGGFHRYSVDERWLVPHFEKMSYDNSELLRNYLHGWQVTLNPFLRQTAEGIVNWVNETLSDQSEGGFYASQDADYSLDDDGDYFTWTLDELRAALPPVQTRVMELHYDVEAQGEMHHNPAKNVLWVARDVREIAKTLSLEESSVRLAIEGAKGKMLAARIQRPTPYIDRTMYINWNAMFVSRD